VNKATCWFRIFVIGMGLGLTWMQGPAHAQSGGPNTVAGVDISDLWWDPAESGWGMQFTQAGDFAFATAFIYGAQNQPTWVTSHLAHGEGAAFTGPLFVTTGSSYGSPWTGASATIREAGTMTFTLLTSSTGDLTYTIDGVTVAKQLQRQTLRFDDYNGDYVSAVYVTASECTDPANDIVYTGTYGVAVSQSSTTMSVAWQRDSESVCTYSGTYGQTGKLGLLSAAYSCTTGEVGTMEFSEMQKRAGMFSARVTGRSSNLGCAYSGKFTGIDISVP